MKLFLSGKTSKPASLSSPSVATADEPAAVNK